MSSSEAESAMTPIDYLFWRDELLQVMYWMLGEGMGAQPTAQQVEAFLGATSAEVGPTLDRMIDDGYVVAAEGGGFALTALGQTEGKRSFSDEFDGLTRQAHGECGPDCIFCNGPDGSPSECPSKQHTHSHAATG